MFPSIPYVSLTEVSEQMDTWGSLGIPFVFYINYDGTQAWAGSREEASTLGIQFAFRQDSPLATKTFSFAKNPISFEDYEAKFKHVQAGLLRGDSFLVNLTAETPIDTDATLMDIYQHAQALYKLSVQDQFVVFSPECFIQIRDERIYSYPMKGTSSATEQGPEQLQNDPKEQAEHATIVDLIRNDLSQVAFPIRVDRYKYMEEIKTHEGNLWQMSSVISGDLMPEYQGKIGQILKTLLPAGSITGAPKASTMRMIQTAEAYDRGFYTGIMGEFDGKNLDSAVMIRFIEQRGNHKIFKSGGGITVNAKAQTEYAELIQKVYLPF
ncbi:aminodeoxychorismate synthase component I [Aquirufa regiilacus]|uniref:Aminodeoxychorismate synthase component I n=1 Tax=Aquirufa regiilacus TaxID=3024868 RepID=A0ABU3TR81_9BACT|nr:MULTISPECIES: aminodeoxychorismate synthase component I [unclassified Aquirufa]MDT8886663.1 aminodeoxychorismate synthase component I [Aquirufa sp. LEPPI-3A]MDU0808372.1 aminodeoxychorismate synthase component I [Aquirufa sp. LEOWEIH-7C]